MFAILNCSVIQFYFTSFHDLDPSKKVMVVNFGTNNLKIITKSVLKALITRTLFPDFLEFDTHYSSCLLWRHACRTNICR